jgi:cytochrome b subunit of formate dehydrogenase
MSLHRKWLFILAGLVCTVLAITGGIMYPPTPWGILTPILYVSVIVLFAIGILRLVYLRGFPE